MRPSPQAGLLPFRARFAGVAVAVCAAGMVAAAALGSNLGIVTLGLALASAAAMVGRPIAPLSALAAISKHFPWQILPLVAGLFVLVDALDRAGILGSARDLLARATLLPSSLSSAATTVSAAVASGAFNNLPVAMAAARTPMTPSVFHAAVLGVDLGPNLCATGSLSTLLWLIAVRREGLDISAGAFFRIGLLAGLPALIAASLLLR